MKVKVEQEKCIGCGACPSLVPEVFDFNDDGLAHAIVDIVPKELEEQTKEAEKIIEDKLIEILEQGEVEQKKELFKKLSCTKNLPKLMLRILENAVYKSEKEKNNESNDTKEN